MSRPLSFVSSSIFAITLATAAVACGGAPDAGPVDAPAASTEAASLTPPSGCHAAATKDGVLGVSCDVLSNQPATYDLEIVGADGSWRTVGGASGTTPDLTGTVGPSSSSTIVVRICAVTADADACGDALSVELPGASAAYEPAGAGGGDWLSRTPAKQ